MSIKGPAINSVLDFENGRLILRIEGCTFPDSGIGSCPDGSYSEVIDVTAHIEQLLRLNAKQR